MSDRYQELHHTRHSFASFVESDGERGVLLTVVNDPEHGPIKAIHVLASRGNQEIDSAGKMSIYLVPSTSMEELAHTVGKDQILEHGPNYDSTWRIPIPLRSAHARFLNDETGTKEPVFNCRLLKGVPEAIDLLSRRHLLQPRVITELQSFEHQLSRGLLYRNIPDMKRILRGEEVPAKDFGYVPRTEQESQCPSSGRIIL